MYSLEGRQQKLLGFRIKRVPIQIWLYSHKTVLQKSLIPPQPQGLHPYNYDINTHFAGCLQKLAITNINDPRHNSRYVVLFSFIF